VPITAVTPDAAYRFCSEPIADRVLPRRRHQVFSEGDLASAFTEETSRRPEHVVCYLFGYTRADIKR